MTEPNTTTSIVIPTYHEEEHILSLVTELLAIPLVTHILVVDDSTNDKTVHALTPLKADSRLTIKHRQQKNGRGSAVFEGLQYLLQHNHKTLL